MIEAIAILTTVVLGLFAGSMLTEALLLVPFFRSLSFDEFNRLHTEFGPRLFRYYAPLTVAATTLPVLSALAIGWAHPNLWPIASAPAVLALLILATYALYFRAANEAFAQKRLDQPQLKKELTRWATVHLFRTALALTSFIASLFAALQSWSAA